MSKLEQTRLLFRVHLKQIYTLVFASFSEWKSAHLFTFALNEFTLKTSHPD